MQAQCIKTAQKSPHKSISAGMGGAAVLAEPEQPCSPQSIRNLVLSSAAHPCLKTALFPPCFQCHSIGTLHHQAGAPARRCLPPDATVCAR